MGLKSREDEGRELFPHLSLILKVNPSKLFLEMVPSTPAYNVTTGIAQMFSWRMKLRL